MTATLTKKTGAAIAILTGAGVTWGNVLEAACCNKLDVSAKDARQNARFVPPQQRRAIRTARPDPEATKRRLRMTN